MKDLPFGLTVLAIAMILSMILVGYLIYDLHDKEAYCKSIGYERYDGGQRSEGERYIQCSKVDKTQTETGYQLETVYSDWRKR